MNGRARIHWSAILCTLVLCSASCSTNDVVDPLLSPALAAEASKPPLDLRLLVAPLEDTRAHVAARAPTGDSSARSAGSTGKAPEGEIEIATTPVPQFDANALRVEIVKALEVARVFKRIRVAEAPSSDEAARIAKDPEYAKQYESSLVAEAYRTGEDLVLTLRLIRYEVSYLGNQTHPGRFYFSAFAFLNWYFPSWWVANEDYACDLELEVTLTAVGSERPLLDRKIYRARTQLILDDFERGISALGPFAVRWSLDEDHWLKVAELVTPPAREEAQVSLARDLKAIDLKAPELESRLLVSVGAGHFQQSKRLRSLLQAEEDAKAMHDLLLKGQVVPAKNAALLVSMAATKAGIVAALQRAVDRARPRDTLYVYFAGFGTAAGGELLIVPADFDLSRPLETGLSLREVMKILDVSPCRQLVLIDASFASAEARSRTLPLPTEAGDTGSAAAPHALKSLNRPGRVVVLAAGPASPAYETDQSNSNFTGFLLEEAHGAQAPADRDGWVTLNAIFEKVRRDTRATFDPPQEPLWLGAAGGALDPREIRIPLVRRSSSAQPGPRGVKTSATSGSATAERRGQ